MFLQISAKTIVETVIVGSKGLGQVNDGTVELVGIEYGDPHRIHGLAIGLGQIEAVGGGDGGRQGGRSGIDVAHAGRGRPNDVLGAGTGEGNVDRITDKPGSRAVLSVP